MPTGTAPPLPPSTAAGGVLARLERAIRCADGFRLCLIRCDDPDFVEPAVAQLTARLRGWRLTAVRLEEPVESLSAALRGRSRPGRAAVSLRGLELSLEPKSPGFTADLAVLAAECPAPLLVWLPGPALDRLQALLPPEGRTAAVYAIEPPPPHVSNCHTPAPETRARALYQAGLAAAAREEWEAAAGSLEGSAALFQQMDDPHGRGAALYRLGLVRQAQARLDDARGLHELAARIAETAGDCPTQAGALVELGRLEQSRGLLSAASERFEASLGLYRELADPAGSAGAAHHLGALRRQGGELEAAHALLAEAVARRRGLDDPAALAASLHLLGTVEQQRGHLEEALRCFEESLTLREADGDESGAAATLGQIGRLHHLRGDLETALLHYAPGWHTLHRLAAPAAPFVLGLIRKLRAEAGERRWEAWLDGELRPLASCLRRSLDAESESRELR